MHLQAGFLSGHRADAGQHIHAVAPGVVGRDADLQHLFDPRVAQQLLAHVAAQQFEVGPV